MLRTVILAMLCLWVGAVNAQQTNLAEPRTYETCFEEAAEAYGIPLEWLFALSFTESSFWPDSSNENSNGTSDFGFMQINTTWKKEAERAGYDWEQIMTNPCANIMFGSYILRHNYDRTKNFSRAIGAYNAGLGRSKRARNNRVRYYRKVKKNIEVAENNLHRLQIPLDPHYYEKLDAQQAAAWRTHSSPIVRLSHVEQLRIDNYVRAKIARQFLPSAKKMKVWLARWYIQAIIDSLDS